MDSKDVRIGEVYQVHHKRKGRFIAQVIGIEQADLDDPQDQFFITVKYDVRLGTDQARLSIEEGKQQVRVSNLRPSLIDAIEPLGGENWLRTVRVPEEDRPAAPTGRLKITRDEPRTLGKRVSEFFRRGGRNG